MGPPRAPDACMRELIRSTVCEGCRDQHGESAGLLPRPSCTSTFGVKKEDSALSAQGTPDPETLLDFKTKY